MNRYDYIDPKPLDGTILKYRHEPYIVGRIRCHNRKYIVTYGRMVNDVFLPYDQLVGDNLKMPTKYAKPETFDAVEEMNEEFGPFAYWPTPTT